VKTDYDSDIMWEKGPLNKVSINTQIYYAVFSLVNEQMQGTANRKNLRGCSNHPMHVTFGCVWTTIVMHPFTLATCLLPDPGALSDAVARS
jgi:hypothetical protein